MGLVISIINQKGGVGKTTTTSNLAVALQQKSNKVLVIDNDAQANATNSFGINDNEVEISIATLLMAEHKLSVDDVKKVICHKHGVDIMPADIGLAHVAEQLRSKMASDLRLKKIVDLIKDEYDYILIDCPPSLGVLSINALVASTNVIIPVAPNFFSIKGIADLLVTIEAVQENLNPALDIMGVLITNYDSRVTLNRTIAESLNDTFQTNVFGTKIRVNKQIEYAQDNMTPVVIYNPTCNGAVDYMSLANEVIGGIGNE